jgi:predicted RNA-binding Zn-ribbon protein involved in translation (DUF1610 family)
MSTKELFCTSCDAEFTVKHSMGQPITYCPFCGEEIQEEDGNTLEEEVSAPE